MSDVELVIKISEETYKDIQSHDWKNGDRWYSEEWKAIHNGISIPKGHGRIGDLDIILNKAKKHRESYMEAENSSYCRGKLHAYEAYVEEVENAPTIIPADKESEI